MSVQPFPSGNRWKDLVDYDGDGNEFLSPKNKREKNNKNQISDIFPSLESPVSTKPQDIPKYITIKASDANNPISNHSVFMIKKAIDAIRTHVLKISMLRDNTLLILTKNKNRFRWFLPCYNRLSFQPKLLQSYHL